jgi:peroxiredoxin
MLSVTKEYGLIHPKVPFISHRATVVIDKQGKVAYCGVQENTGAERDWAPIQACLAKLA